MAGYDVAGAGDLNGDGLADLLIGAHTFDTSAWLVYGPVLGDLELSTAPVRFRGGDGARTVAGRGDVDGDGLDDVLFSHGAGTTWLFTRPLSGNVSTSSADATLISAVDEAGAALDFAGDVDGDGHDDLILGAANSSRAANEAGAAYVVHGPLQGTVELEAAELTLLGESAFSNAGSSVAGAGDLDGDGFADVWVGAPGSERHGGRAGAAYLILGQP